MGAFPVLSSNKAACCKSQRLAASLLHILRVVAAGLSAEILAIDSIPYGIRRVGHNQANNPKTLRNSSVLTSELPHLVVGMSLLRTL